MRAALFCLLLAVWGLSFMLNFVGSDRAVRTIERWRCEGYQVQPCARTNQLPRPSAWRDV